MHKTIQPSHFIAPPVQQKMAANHQEIGKASSTKVLPILAVVTFMLGLISGVIFTSTVQQEDQQFNSQLINGLKKEVYIQKEQVKLSGLILELNHDPQNSALRGEAAETLDHLNRLTPLQFGQNQAGETEVTIEGQTFVLPFSWQAER